MPCERLRQTARVGDPTSACLPLMLKQPGAGTQVHQEAEAPTSALAPYLAPRAIFAPVFLCGRLCHVRGLLPLATEC